MKKNLTRVLALAMALLMCLSLLPVSALAGDADFAAMIASAQAAQAAAMGGAAPDVPFVMPEQALDYTDPNVCLASEDGQHLWIEVHDPAYICAWGDCTEENPHILYKSCAYCKQSAEPLYANELEAIQNEAQVFAETQEEIPPEQYDDWDYRAYHKYIFELPDHFYEKQDGQAPTCTAGGHTAYEQCSVCEEIRGYEELDPLGHNWGDYTVTVEPTCTAAGTKMRECLRCGEKEYVDIPALGHDWGEFVTVKEPTCTETGTTKRVCERCGAEDFGEIPANGHSYGDFTILKEATCTEDGSKEHTCAVCEYKETVVIPAAHTWGDFTVTKEATCTEAGEQEHTCTVCDVTETVTIPAKDHSYGEDGVCTVCGAEKPAEPTVVEPTVEEPVVEESKEEESEKEPAGAQPVGAIVEDCRDMYSSFGAFLAEQNAADAKYVVASYTPVDANGHALGEIPAGGVRFDLPLPEGADAASVQVYTYDYSTYSWSPANFFLSDGQATVSSGAYPYPPFAVVAAPAAAGNSGETTPTKQEAVSAEVADEFKNLLNEKGLSNDSGDVVLQDVTPLREDGSEMSNEEVAAMGGVTFEMDLPENYEEGDELAYYHQNSETGEWELITDYEIKGNKVILKLDHFSPVGGGVVKKNNPILGAPGSISVELNPNGGTGTQMSPIVGNEGTSVTLPSENEFTYTREGYNFAGWNTEADGTGTSYGTVNNPYGATYTIHAGETLYAKWAKIVTLTFDFNGGTSTNYPTETKISIDVSTDAAVNLPDDTELGLSRNFNDSRDYKFTGWNLDQSGTKEDSGHRDAGKSYIISGDATLYAEWAKPVTVSYKGNDATSGYMPDDTSHFVGDEITLAPNGYTKYTDGVSYIFTEWNTLASGSGVPYEDEEEVYLSDNLTLYAQWAREINVIFYPNGENVIPNTLIIQDIPAGYYTSLNPTQFKRDRFDFTGWNTKADNSGTPYKDKEEVFFTEDTKLYAQWEQNEFHVSFYDGDTHLVDKDKDVEKGGKVEMPEYSSPSHPDEIVIGWTLTQGSSKVDCKVGQGYQPTKDVTFYPVFAEAVTVTFYDNAQGTGTSVTRQFPRGVAANLPTVTDLGFNAPANKHFKEWRDQTNEEGTEDKELKGYSYADRQSVSLTAPLTLYAQWADGAAPSAPTGISISRQIVNYGNTVLHGHPATVTGVNTQMEYYANGTWNKVSGDTQNFETPDNYEFRYKETSSSPASESVEVTVKSYVSKASAPTDKSTGTETRYRYDVSIYERAKSGEDTLVDHFPPADFPTEEEIYFLLSYPAGLSKDSHKLKLIHVPDQKEVEIEQLNDGILGSSTSFSDFDLIVEDKLHGNVILSPNAPKAGEPITATVTDDNNKGTLEYRWLRDGTPIGSWSESNTYIVSSADLKHKLSCEVKSSDPSNGTITSGETSTITITTTEVTDPNSAIIGYFDGVVEGMQYKIGDGVWVDVPGTGALVGNRLYVDEPGTYTFRNKNESKEQYWDTGTLDRWYLIGFTSTNATSTTTTTNGATTSTSGSGTTYMYMIPESSTSGTGTRLTTATSTADVKYYGSGNYWKVKQGSTTRFYIEMKPSSGSYVHYNRNNDGYAPGTTGEVRVYLGSGNNGYVNQNDYFNVIYNRSSTSPRTADDSHLGLWSALCFMSLAGATILLNGQRKRRKARR